MNDEISALLLGFAAGIRSATPLAAIAKAQRDGELKVGRPWCYAGSARGQKLLSLGAGGELFADKLPFTPSRLQLGSLVVRAATGGFSGACVGGAGDLGWKRGAMLGAAGAVAGSFAGYHARSRLSSLAVKLGSKRGVSPGIASFAVAALEDAVGVGLSKWALSQRENST